MNTFVILKILAALMLPPASLAAGVVLSLLLRLVGWRRLAGATLGVALFQILVLSFPPVTRLLNLHLEAKARELVAGNQPCCYDAIVVLGGSIAPAAPPYTTEPELSDASDRIWHAARMFKAGAAPRIIVSGGSFVEQQGGPATTEAEAMRRFLIDLGIPSDAIVSEGKSLNTIENMRNVRELVKGGRVAIVTSAFHVPRAARLAKRAGLNFAIFGVNWTIPNDAIPWWDAWLPSVGALGESNLAIKELVALSLDRRGDSLAP
ncbi:MAG: YdcF family protein [Reyranella sp.]|uniref:YdcF family protein n=1 Tax=Reyranella sp. TaxID=1929291 RepID=UPI0012150B31|nr:YdcF family protein [Reyranella sp.]TAJ95508.1 MAG: YdcF family protein [Reyranella sp.]